MPYPVPQQCGRPPFAEQAAAPGQEPVGYLPRLPQAVVESRHLGLKTAGEITDLAQKIGLLADALEANLDWATLEALPAGRSRFPAGA